LQEVYHVLRPHPALATGDGSALATTQQQQQQQQHEKDYFQLLTQGILAVVLPTEDLRNPCLRTLASDIVADMILGNVVAGRLCEPTFVYDSIRKTCESMRKTPWALDPSKDMEERLERFGLISADKEPTLAQLRPLDINELFWMVAQYCFLAITTLRSLIELFMASSKMPVRLRPERGSNTKFPAAPQSLHPAITPDDATRHQALERRAMIDYAIWPALATLICLPTRMPWLHGLLQLIHRLALSGWGKIGRTNGSLDRCVICK